ncbi:MAG: amidase domain-containing protein [Firmicutes bacterium]|nr:amidase domain-containing protein [Bacillota bacterium]
MMITYNRFAAVEYAKRWAYERNPEFSDFTQLGGNCTNFVSQCLLAGGMPMNYDYPLGWFYKSLNNRAAAFTGVEYLFNFLTRSRIDIVPVAKEVDVSEGKIGDIIQMSFDGTNFTHAVIIVETNGNDPLIAANTYDVFCTPLSNYNFQKMRTLHILGANH